LVEAVVPGYDLSTLFNRMMLLRKYLTFLLRSLAFFLGAPAPADFQVPLSCSKLKGCGEVLTLPDSLPEVT
jgi:hypothetical protein